MGVLEEWTTPVFSYTPLESNIKPYVTFNCWVDEPVGTLDSCTTVVEQLESWSL